MSLEIRPLPGPAEISGTAVVGIEFMNKECWRCGKQLYCVSGFVTVVENCQNWAMKEWRSGKWSIKDFYALYQASESVARQVADCVAQMARTAASKLSSSGEQLPTLQKRFIKNANQHLWTNVCPSCRSHDGPAKLIENERYPLLLRYDWKESVAKRRLVYRPCVLHFDVPQMSYETIKYSRSGYPD